jgi:hypothetical protein
MSLRCATAVWLLLVFGVVSASGCQAEARPVEPTGSGAGFDEGAFWESLPQPEDAEAVEVGAGFDLGFATGMIESQVFDFYATWLSEQGWRRQAPTEAMVTLPRQVWRGNGAELLIEVQGLDEPGRSVVWLQVEAH